MPNVIATLPNIGGALCSTPQFGWRPLLECRAAHVIIYCHHLHFYKDVYGLCIGFYQYNLLQSHHWTVFTVLLYRVVFTCGVYHDVTGRATGRHSRYTTATSSAQMQPRIQICRFIGSPASDPQSIFSINAPPRTDAQISRSPASNPQSIFNAWHDAWLRRPRVKCRCADMRICGFFGPENDEI